MRTPEVQLSEIGIVLPPAVPPVAAYIPVRLVGNLAFVAGQIPMRDGKLMASGTVPDKVSVEDAAACARQCAINALAALKAELGELARVKQIVRVGVFVACGSGFFDHPQVANGASELLQQVFGEAGKHARAAVGAPSLPRGAPVEVELVCEFRAPS
ncbi:MAG: RidA family protein [Phycisphaeraceae bacterium]|nr:RidA family protein [Phycisphaeraceae bacterium]